MQVAPTVFVVPPAGKPTAAVLQGVHTCGPGGAAVFVLNGTLHNAPDCAPSLLDALRQATGVSTAFRDSFLLDGAIGCRGLGSSN